MSYKAELAGFTFSDSTSALVPNILNLDPVSSEISDLTPCAHAHSNILHIKSAKKTLY